MNVCAPRAVTNIELTATLARVLRRPAVLPVPAFALRTILGEMAEALVFTSLRVVPERLVASGYEFRSPELEQTLRHVLGRYSPSSSASL